MQIAGVVDKGEDVEELKTSPGYLKTKECACSLEKTFLTVALR